MTLAPDKHVPRRDSLLRPETMAGVVSQRLHQGVPVERCERTYVKYPAKVASAVAVGRTARFVTVLEPRG